MPAAIELFAHGGIRGIADLKGKSVGQLGGPELISMMAAYVGLDPKKDLTLVDDPAAKPVDLFAEGKLDAYLAFPPEVQELHARKVGHVILRTAVDRPGRSISAACWRRTGSICAPASPNWRRG